MSKALLGLALMLCAAIAYIGLQFALVISVGFGAYLAAYGGVAGAMAVWKGFLTFILLRACGYVATLTGVYALSKA